jgi:hypothetical protein
MNLVQKHSKKNFIALDRWSEAARGMNSFSRKRYEAMQMRSSGLTVFLPQTLRNKTNLAGGVFVFTHAVEDNRRV